MLLKLWEKDGSHQGILAIAGQHLLPLLEIFVNLVPSPRPLLSNDHIHSRDLFFNNLFNKLRSFLTSISPAMATTTFAALGVCDSHTLLTQLKDHETTKLRIGDHTWLEDLLKFRPKPDTQSSSKPLGTLPLTWNTQQNSPGCLVACFDWRNVAVSSEPGDTQRMLQWLTKLHDMLLVNKIPPLCDTLPPISKDLKIFMRIRPKIIPLIVINDLPELAMTIHLK